MKRDGYEIENMRMSVETPLLQLRESGIIQGYKTDRTQPYLKTQKKEFTPSQSRLDPSMIGMIKNKTQKDLRTSSNR